MSLPIEMLRAVIEKPRIKQLLATRLASNLRHRNIGISGWPFAANSDFLGRVSGIVKTYVSGGVSTNGNRKEEVCR